MILFDLFGWGFRVGFEVFEFASSFGFVFFLEFSD